LRWPGGKRLLAAEILAHLPDHEAYVEACCGGAAVFWAKERDRSQSEILNDRDGELINFYWQLHKAGRRLAKEVDAMPYGRAFFAKMCAATPRGTFQRAARFWYLNRVAFGGRRRRPTFGVGVSRRMYVLPKTVLANLDATIERLRGVVFESVDVVRLLSLYDRKSTAFLVDPPYLGLHQDYDCQFDDADHHRLADALRHVKGAWLLTYNDCRQIKKLYDGLPRKRLTTRYTMGCNSVTGGYSRAHELLISNRALRCHPPGDRDRTGRDRLHRRGQ